MKKPLEPLIPLDELKKVVAGLARVPKDALDEIEAGRKNRKQSAKTTQK